MRYYAGNDFFRAIRTRLGIVKPKAETWKGWEEWKIRTKAEKPVAFWLTENLPDALQKVTGTFTEPVRNIRYYIRNRWHRQTHVLPTGFKPGTYHDLSERLLHGIMQSIVDFIEVEKAWMQYVMDDTGTVKLGKGGRSRSGGLAYLEWESTLDDLSLSENERSEEQAKNARELIKLYVWWMDIRPHRPDPYDMSGWSKYCDERRAKSDNEDDWIFDFKDETEEDQIRSKNILKSLHDLEAAYAGEDQQML